MAEVPETDAPVNENIEMDLDAAITSGVMNDKITILRGYAPDFSAATFCLKEEDHTLGNALRYMIMKDPRVEFCGYSIPHPSEAKIHIRIQMYDKASALSALSDALNNLESLCETVLEAYETDLGKETYEKFEEPELDREAIAKAAQEGKRRREEEAKEKEKEKERERRRAAEQA